MTRNTHIIVAGLTPFYSILYAPILDGQNDEIQQQPKSGWDFPRHLCCCLDHFETHRISIPVSFHGNQSYMTALRGEKAKSILKSHNNCQIFSKKKNWNIHFHDFVLIESFHICITVLLKFAIAHLRVRGLSAHRELQTFFLMIDTKQSLVQTHCHALRSVNMNGSQSQFAKRTG